MQQQREKIFFDPTTDRSMPALPSAPTDEQITMLLSNNNARCPLTEIIVSDANEGNMRTLRRFAHTALSRVNRSCRGCNFGIYAGAGQGKTYIVKQWAKTIGIPFILVQSASLTDTWSLFEIIRMEISKHIFSGDSLYTPADTKFPKVVEWKNGTCDYRVPPCIVFFDEAHLIPKKMMEGGLLNGMEADDGIMAMRPAAKADVVYANMRQVCWVAATTERGRLFDAFEMRLSSAIEWQTATIDEIAHIVKVRIDAEVRNKELPFGMPPEICQLVAKYRRVPRMAIAFAKQVIQQKKMMSSDTWEEAVAQVARDNDIDEDGFSHKQINILTALGQRPIALNGLSGVAKCRLEQVERYELPLLMSYDNGGPFMSPVGGKGMAITEAGIEFLDRRGIENRGSKVTVEYFESRR